MTAKRGCRVKEGVLFHVLKMETKCVYGLMGKKQEGGIEEWRAGTPITGVTFLGCTRPRILSDPPPKSSNKVHAVVAFSAICFL